MLPNGDFDILKIGPIAMRHFCCLTDRHDGREFRSLFASFIDSEAQFGFAIKRAIAASL